MRLSPALLLVPGLWSASAAFASERSDDEVPPPPEEPVCAAPTDVSQLRFAYEAALQAWTSFDLPGLQQAVRATDNVLVCAKDVLGPEDVAAYWRIQGLGAFSRGDIAATELALAAARRVQPTYTLPADLVPEQHPLHQMWDRAGEAAPPEVRELAPPLDGWLQVEGRRTTVAPAEAPFVFQWVRDSGVAATERVAVGANPVYDLVPPPIDHHVSRKFMVGGVASGLLAGVAMGTAGALRVQYNHAPIEDGELNSLRTTNTAFGVAGVGFAVVGVGLGVGALAVGDW